MYYQTKKTKVKEATSKASSWIRGLDTIVSNTQIKPDEVSQMIDCQLVEDGKIQCPRDGQAYFGGTSGSRVTGLFPFYKSDGTNQLLRMSGTTLQVHNTTTDAWDNVAGYAYTTTLNAEAVTAYDKLYIGNGTDPLTNYAGTSVSAYTAILAPDAPTVTRTGTTGSYVFSYKVTAVTANGETTPSAEGHSDLNVNTLDSSSYMSLSWSAVDNAIGYNVYGRKDGNWKFMLYLDGNGSTTYVDKGAISPRNTVLPPEGNTTGGVVGACIALYKDTLFVSADPDNPSRVYYSGGGDKIDDFTIGSGGGFIDISKNDGQIVTKMIPYRNYLLIFKTDSLYQFAFTSDGLPSITQVSPSIGAISARSVVGVENDVFFASRRGIFTVGNESGYGFDVLRTNELSARIRPIFQTIATAYLDNISAIYATKGSSNLVIFSYTPTGATTNSKAIVYDRERLAWYEWTNIKANCWTSYIDSTGNTRVLYGDDSSGYVKEILTGSDDFGSAILGTFRLRSEDFNNPNVYKKLDLIDLILREPTGTVTLNVIVDGITTELTVPITTVTPLVNWGHYVFTDFLFGESIGTGSSSQDNNLLKTIKKPNVSTGRSFLLEFKNSSGGSFTLLFAGMTARLKADTYRKVNDVVSVS